jgi:hypothetical protein
VVVVVPFMEITVKSGDGLPGVPIDELVKDLAELAHVEAAQHWGSKPDCSYLAFAAEPLADGAGNREIFGREQYEKALREMHVTDEAIAGHLRDWDEDERPVVIVHYWEVPDPAMN